MDNSIEPIDVAGHADEEAKDADFVVLLEQRNLQALTQQVLMYLLVPFGENYIKDLAETARVSNVWRRAVDELVHGTAVGRRGIAVRSKQLVRARIERIIEPLEKLRQSDPKWKSAIAAILFFRMCSYPGGEEEATAIHAGLLRMLKSKEVDASVLGIIRLDGLHLIKLINGRLADDSYFKARRQKIRERDERVQPDAFATAWERTLRNFVLSTYGHEVEEEA